ncbi:MAG TPA: TerB family tellurite resistance protein [Anaeromyxobacteraceae bacterium]|nr:TerB family tellurite resistance protein [Anaeromyxobacteraceae bacterium]
MIMNGVPMPATTKLFSFATALRGSGTKIYTAIHQLKQRESEAEAWIQRFIYHELEHRAQTRSAAYWETLFPDMPPEKRAQRCIDRVLTRATVAGVVGAAGASTAEVLSLAADRFGLGAVSLGIVSVGAEFAYTAALQIDLAFDLASIYGVPFARDDVGEIATLLGMALGIELVDESTRHDKPSSDPTKPWRVMRQMLNNDFAEQIAGELLQQAVLRNVVPIAGILVSAAWHQIVLRRFAHQVDAAMRQRRAVVRACREVQLPDRRAARTILDGAWLLATADGDVRHEEALALATLIDSLKLPERIPTHEASFSDDDEAWFLGLRELDPRAHTALIEVLSLVACADGEFSTAERRFLRRLGRALGREVDLRTIERLAESIGRGETPWRPLAELRHESADPPLAVD